VFTARYGLIPYIKQIRLVPKLLNTYVERMTHERNECFKYDGPSALLVAGRGGGRMIKLL